MPSVEHWQGAHTYTYSMSDEEDDDGADEDIPRKSETGISGDGVRGRRDMRHSAVPVPTAVPRDEVAGQGRYEVAGQGRDEMR